MVADGTLDSTLGDLEHEPAADSTDAEWSDAGWNDWQDAFDMDTGPVHDVESDTGVDVDHSGESEFTYITRHEDVELQDGSVVHHEYDAQVEDTGDWTNTIEGDWTNVEGDALNINTYGDTHYNAETGELETDVDIYQHHDDGSTTEINYDHDTDFSTGDDDASLNSTYYENPATDVDDGGADTSSMDTGSDDY